MQSFLAGMTTMGFLVASLVFIRLWRRGNDMLFAWFGVAFLLLALNQAIPVLTSITREEYSWVSLLRLLAFGVIIVAVVHKNREPTLRQ
jgi:hypothetical protein